MMNKKYFFLTLLLFCFTAKADIIKSELIKQLGYYDEQVYCLAEAVVFESISEPEEGKFAVAYVVKNRVKTNPKFYGKTYCDVVRKKHQFSYQKLNKKDWLKKNIKTKNDFRKLSDCVKIAIIVDRQNKTKIAARYFMNEKIAVKTASFKMMKMLKKIGNHNFY